MRHPHPPAHRGGFTIERCDRIEFRSAPLEPRLGIAETVSTGLRIAATVVWIAFMVFVATWDASTPALVVAAVATVALGVLVGRWWVALVPLALGVSVSVMLLLGESHELDMPALAGYAALWTLGITALVALGVGLDHGVRAITGGQSGRRPHSRRPAG